MAVILIADDVQTDRELLGRVVINAGHNPVYASNGDEAVAKAKELKPALIFLDVVMPGLNGFNACRLLKQDPETKPIPVVMVTSKNQESDRFWGQRQGADEYIGKPFTPDSVGSVLRRFVR